MFLEATLPKSLWRTPSLKATLTFPEGTQPAEIRLNVEGLSSAVKSAIGLDVDLKINTPET